jgi:hypothetical protein
MGRGKDLLKVVRSGFRTSFEFVSWATSGCLTAYAVASFAPVQVAFTTFTYGSPAFRFQHCFCREP